MKRLPTIVTVCSCYVFVCGPSNVSVWRIRADHMGAQCWELLKEEIKRKRDVHSSAGRHTCTQSERGHQATKVEKKSRRHRDHILFSTFNQLIEILDCLSVCHFAVDHFDLILNIPSHTGPLLFALLVPRFYFRRASHGPATHSSIVCHLFGQHMLLEVPCSR